MHPAEPMPLTDDAPCPWPVDTSCCGEDWPEDPDCWTAQHHRAVEIATDVLWRLVSGRYGLCREVIRPCLRDCHDGSVRGWGGRWWWPVVEGGRWYNRPSCGCRRAGCSCDPLCVIDLPGPVHQVLDVRRDGAVVDPGAWTVHHAPGGTGRLIRTDGQCWPECQDLTAPETEPGTLAVHYLHGRPVPAAGRRAVGQLACEIYRRCVTGGSGCALPVGVTTVEREGVTYDIAPPEGWTETLRLHLPEVYAWAELVNPGLSPYRPAVYSPDLPPAPVATRHRHRPGAWP